MNENSGRIYKTVDKTVDKTGWADGPWQTEPDRIEWTDPNTGYPCVICRHPRHGSLNGYIGLPFNHPCWGQRYDSIDVDVHGGLTYADQYPPSIDRADLGANEQPDADGQWWIGFDCGHYMDVMPGLDAILRSLGHEPSNLGFDIPPALQPSYKTIEYVRAEVTQLAKQAHAITRKADGSVKNGGGTPCAKRPCKRSKCPRDSGE